MEELMILASIELHVEEGHLNSAVVSLYQVANAIAVISAQAGQCSVACVKQF